MDPKRLTRQWSQHIKTSTASHKNLMESIERNIKVLDESVSGRRDQQIRLMRKSSKRYIMDQIARSNREVVNSRIGQGESISAKYSPVKESQVSTYKKPQLNEMNPYQNFVGKNRLRQR